MINSFRLRAVTLALGSLTLGACSNTVVVEPDAAPYLSAEPSRLTGEVIERDRAYIQSLQDRLEALNAAGRSADDYHFCKTQAWLDMAFNEYTDNDRTGVVEAALTEALALIQRMEIGDDDLPVDTPIIDTSEYVRSDLWAVAAANKDHPDGVCLSCLSAKLEVQLVWVGHEKGELGFRHALSESKAAERYARRIESGEAGCVVAAATLEKIVPGDPTVAPPAEAPAIAGIPTPQPGAILVAEFARDEMPAPAPQPVVVRTVPMPASVALVEFAPKAPQPAPEPAQTVTQFIPDTQLPRYVHFALRDASLSVESQDVVEVIARVLHEKNDLEIGLVGHTDVRGMSYYNEALAERRVAAVRDALVAAGIDAGRLFTSVVGPYQPRAMGGEADAHARNRRVELVIESGHLVELLPQEDDLQSEEVLNSLPDAVRTATQIPPE